MRSEFTDGLEAHLATFRIELSDTAIGRLSDFYELTVENNPLLHLVAPCTAGEFATRHVLESLTLLKHLPAGARFADVGTGGGFPSIPCLLVREDLSAVLIESNLKKARYLAGAVETLGLSDRVSVFDRQFREADISGSKFVTSRALDRFAERLPILVRWAKDRTLLLFGGRDLEDRLQDLGLRAVQELMPLSEQRFLYIAKR